jgi:enamine deaminase RidA (YjgF/YER057c/UK114 family)
MGSGPGFSRAVEAPRNGRTIYCAGAAPTDDRGQTVPGGAKEQAEASLGKLKALVEEAGGTMDDVVMMNTYVTKMSYIDEIREVRERFFPNSPFPAGSGFEVSALANPDWLIEIDCIAVVED